MTDSLLQEPHCLHCLEIPDTKLLRCSRCQVAWYCNKDCQKEHFTEHRDLCKAIAKVKKDVDEQGDKLRSAPDNIFETDPGNFWGIPEAIHYMEATYAISNLYWAAAHERNIKEVREKALFYLLENLRLGCLDKMEAQLRAPLFLLSVNRDDDAYCFIRYWMQLLDVLAVNPDALQNTHAYSKEGDWIYPRETNCRYLDVFEDIFSNKEPQADLAFLFALVIIKLRIVAAHDDATQSVELEGVDVESQREQANRLRLTTRH